MSTTLLEPDSLKDFGVSAQTVRKLIDNGITTMEALAYSPPKEVVDYTGIGIETAEKAVRRAQSIVSPGFRPADEFKASDEKKPLCTTGCGELDRILGGGIRTGAITEIIGEYAGGKTQLCFVLAVMAQRPVAEGGLDGRVAYIDTEGTFVSSRVEQIAEARGFDPSESLRGILLAKAFNTTHQLLLISQLNKLCQENNIRLVVVDSMISHLRDEYIGRATLADRQGQLGRMLGQLLRIAEANTVAVVVTNQMITTPDGALFGDPNKPAGGHIMAHAGTYRLRLWKSSANTRVAAVIDSSHLPEEKIRFAITEKGIEDLPDKKEPEA